MNPTELMDRLQAADDLEVDHVDAIIAEAIAQGRQRRRVRRRALPVLAGIVALATALGLAGILAVRDGRSSTPVATTTPSTSAATPTPPGLTSGDVLDVVRAYLPKGMSATEQDLWGDPQADEEMRANNAYVIMTLEDNDGPARAEVHLRSKATEGQPGNGCTRQGHCRRIRVGGKTFYEYTDWKTYDGVRAYDVGTYYTRPDGHTTGIKQHNFVDYGGPVTRPTPRGLAKSEGWPVTGKTMPLTEAEVQELLTAPEWDALAARCQRDRFFGYC